MLNSTCFKSVTIRAKIKAAMKQAISLKGGSVILKNRKGKAYLCIQRVTNLDSMRCFEFTSQDSKGNMHYVTEHAYKGLRA